MERWLFIVVIIILILAPGQISERAAAQTSTLFPRAVRCGVPACRWFSPLLSPTRRDVQICRLWGCFPRICSLVIWWQTIVRCREDHAFVKAQHYFSPHLLRICPPRAIIFIFYIPIRLWYFTKCCQAPNWCLPDPSSLSLFPVFRASLFIPDCQKALNPKWMYGLDPAWLGCGRNLRKGGNGILPTLHSRDFYGRRRRWHVIMWCYREACSKHCICGNLRIKALAGTGGKALRWRFE